jgi:hypothetical protein
MAMYVLTGRKPPRERRHKVKDTVDTTRTWFVVRSKRNGKFVRAFTTQEQAQKWCNGEKAWTYALEQMHDYDADGHVFDVYKKAEAK